MSGSRQQELALLDPKVEPESTQANIKPVGITKEVNILLLGQTGVGKSTFINALFNYLKFKDFESAATHNALLEVPIACKFTIFDENNKERTVISDYPDNENFDPGRFGTRGCKTYEFQHKDRLVRIFDTPGLCDTRDQTQDKENLEATLKVLRKHERLHSVCILLKANKSRLTETFKTSITPALNQLPKSAIKNITFVFTHTRGTHYRLGDTYSSLKAFLEDIKAESTQVSVLFNENNVFCVDNEAFRYLLAMRNGITFLPEEVEDFKKSWNKSKEICVKLLGYIMDNSDKCTFSIEEMQSLNHVRKAIADFAEPSASTLENIWDNLDILKKQNGEVKKCNKKEDLEQLMHFTVKKWKVNDLNALHLVCQSEKCTREGAQKCCQPSNCQEKHVVNKHENLIEPFAARKTAGNCPTCKCPNDKHMQIYRESIMEDKKIVDENIFEEMKKNFSNGRELVVKKINSEIISWQQEMSQLIGGMAKMAVFLRRNSITAFTDMFELCLQTMGTEAKMEAKAFYEELKAKYKQEKLNNQSCKLTVEDMSKVIRDLCSMKRIGKVLTCNLIHLAIKNESSLNNYLPSLNTVGMIVAGTAAGAVISSVLMPVAIGGATVTLVTLIGGGAAVGAVSTMISRSFNS